MKKIILALCLFAVGCKGVETSVSAKYESRHGEIAVAQTWK